MRSDYELDVFWNDRKAGTLTPAEHGGVCFSYDDGWLASNGRAISLSLPVREKSFDAARSTCFFENLLPEGRQLEELCRRARIAAGDTYAFLEEYGMECAGALSVRHTWDDRPAERSYRDITEELEAQLATDAGRDVNLIASSRARLSVAGAQNKLPVYRKDGRFLVPAADSTAPTNAILKPAASRFSELPRNESYCMALASEAGLDVPRSEIVMLGESPVFVVSRYDRPEADGIVTRLHQEDFCQALGVGRLRKYEADGGPGFGDCAALLMRREIRDSISARQSMIRCALFNYLIGNCDAHAKNFSLLHTESGITLAPFYDLVSTMAYAHLDSRLAMTPGRTADYSGIDSGEWRSFAGKMRVSPSVVFTIMAEVHDAVKAAAVNILERQCDILGPSKICYDILLIIRNGLRAFEQCLRAR